mmetsp:Transcript_20032/g.34449  ORF Transcript_20032/g.34449 Transcript_20032/m.34449 type:complete len:335 (+) Transcript_20032:44-1048(+)
MLTRGVSGLGHERQRRRCWFRCGRPLRRSAREGGGRPMGEAGCGWVRQGGKMDGFFGGAALGLGHGDEGVLDGLAAGDLERELDAQRELLAVEGDVHVKAEAVHRLHGGGVNADPDKLGHIPLEVVPMVLVHVAHHGRGEVGKRVGMRLDVLLGGDGGSGAKALVEAHVLDGLHMVQGEVAPVDPHRRRVPPPELLQQRILLSVGNLDNVADEGETGALGSLVVGRHNRKARPPVRVQVLGVRRDGGEGEEGSAGVVDGEVHHGARRVTLQPLRYSRQHPKPCEVHEGASLLRVRWAWQGALFLEDLLNLRSEFLIGSGRCWLDSGLGGCGCRG